VRKPTDSVTFTLEPFLVSDADAARLLGISVAYFRSLEKRGDIGPLPVRLGSGKRRLHRVAELRRWVAAGMPPRESWLAAREGAKRG
jgi:hypothetical protein